MRRRAANDPSVDPVLTAIMRYTLPVAVVAGLRVILFAGWLFSL